MYEQYQALTEYSKEILVQFSFLLNTIFQLPLIISIQNFIDHYVGNLYKNVAEDNIKLNFNQIQSISKIFVGFMFLFLGRSMFEILVFLLGFIFGVGLVFYGVITLEINQIIDNSDTIKISFILVIALTSGVFWARFYRKIFSSAFWILVIPVTTIVAYNFAKQIASLIIGYLSLEQQQFGVYSLRAFDVFEESMPGIGATVFHILFFICILSTLKLSKVFTLMIIIFVKYRLHIALNLDQTVPYNYLANFFSQNVKIVTVNSETATIIFGFLVLIFELYYIALNISLTLFIASASSLIGSLLIAAGSEKIFANFFPQVRKSLLLFDRGLNLKTSSLSLLVTSLCLIAGIFVQIW